MESRWTELCNKLYKTEEEQQIFLGFSIFLKQEQKEIAIKARKLKRKTKRNNGNIFGLFMFWKVEIKMRTIKKMKHGYTKDRLNIICR
jgi:hypothetical protein